MNALAPPAVPLAEAPVPAGNGSTLPVLDAATPLLLLPVNIETRFIDGAKGAELWLRVYPDQIAIDSHDPALTAQEIADATSYWDAVWRAGNPPASLDAVQAPWRGLASRYGAPRAAWIALQMTPANVAQQPAAATPAGADPAPAPVPPAPPTRPGSWSKPAVAAALPDAWTVVTVQGTTTETHRGSAIAPALAVGLTPPASAFPPGSPVDASMQWLVDFDIAVQAGMALRIPLTPQQRAHGFERIYVYGLRGTAANQGGSATFAALLAAHHYSDGFSLVGQGAPTNNTADVDSAYARKDTDFAASFAIERQAALNQQADADGNAFASLTGVDPATLAHVGVADATFVRNGRDMLGALWPATLGYFLGQMMADVFTPAQIESARQYALAHVVPRGPVPALRVGRTPYGVLPVTSLRFYPREADRAAGTIEPALVDFLRRMWPNWLASSAGAPHMQGSGDPDAQLVQVLGMDASSMTFRGREVLGDGFLWNYALFQKMPLATLQAWWNDHLARGRQLLDAYQFQQWDPRVIHLGLAENSYPVPYPTVQAGKLSETDALKADATLGDGTHANYIQWLRQASVSDLQSENYPGTRPTALLYKILRQSLLLDYARLATLAEIAASRLTLAQVKEQEIVGVVAAAPQVATAAAPAAALPAVSVWEVLARPSLPDPAIDWAQYLVQLDPPPESPFAQLAELRTSLDRLAALPTAELDRLLTETLDACSHRLDVWVTGVASALLARRRGGQVAGTHLGAYGWVEEVRPSAQRVPVSGTELASVQLLDRRRAASIGKDAALLPVPAQPMSDNGGYILAPSQAHAAVAAVLRSGYMTHKGTSEEGQLSIDLSSRRVRRALRLLEGVQQGQSLNALLGYLFEDGLHGLQLDQYAQPFRNLFPVAANKLTPSSDPAESVAASDVVDGLALRTAWDAGKLALGLAWGDGLPGPGNPDQQKILGLFTMLDDHADALADLSIAEAVFQVVRGNFGQAGTLMDAISKGARPPDPAIVNTPRGGLDLTHRLGLLFAGDPPAATAWSTSAATPRALAEPWLNQWVAQRLPAPSTVRCTVRYQDGATAARQVVDLAALQVQPLDVLAMSDIGQAAAKGELENRVLLAAALPATASNAAIDFTAAGLPAGSVIFPDAFFLAKSLRTLIGSARPLGPQDLTVPEDDPATLGGVTQLAELRTRAAAARGSTATDLAALATAVAGLPGSAPAVRDALRDCSLYGVAGSIPTPGATAATLATQASAVTTVLQERADKAVAVNIATATAADLVGIFATLFGADFVVLPAFTRPDAASLQKAFGQSAALVASEPQAPVRWLAQLTQVRPAVSRLDAALSMSRLLADAGAPALLLGQLPAVDDDRWLGLALDPANLPPKGRVAFACIAQGDAVAANRYAGLLLDEWSERIPSTQENTAVAFHYEEPKARGPQALLLAVCPDRRAAWDDALLQAILDETLELAKIRTVDLDSIQQAGQILPALYFALNLQGATPSTNFALFKELPRAVASLR